MRKILFGKITHFEGPKIRKNACKEFGWESRIPHFIAVRDLFEIEIQIQCCFQFQK